MRKKTLIRVSVALLIISLLVLIAGCGTEGENNDSPPADDQGAYPMVVSDDAGRKVEIASLPERIVSLFPSHTEILFALELGEKVVGVTDFCNYPPEAADKEKIGDSFNINVEKIISLEPDLVLAPAGDASAQAIEILAESGIPALILNPTNIAQVEETIHLIGEITGTAEKAQEIVATMEAEKEEVVSAVSTRDQTPKVLVLIDTTSLYTVGSGQFIDELITLAGGKNIAADYGEGYFIISEETILQENPDVIISTFPMKEEIMARENWQDLAALKNGKIFDVNGDLVGRQGPRITQGLKAVYDVLYR